MLLVPELKRLVAAAYLYPAACIATFLAGCPGGSGMNARTVVDGGGQVAPPLSPCEEDLGLSAERCAEVLKLQLPEALPASAGNRVADNVEAARLGFLVFYDQGFSTIPDVRCASCHLPESGFGDARPVSEVITGRPGARNSPSILNAAWAGPFFFWDGRADSLWSQPLAAFENPDEMAGSRLAIAHALYKQPAYRSRYESLFGPLPDLTDSQRFPAQGKPGDAAFDGMPEADQNAINMVAANLGKALEAYMRKVATGPTTLDRYLAGERDALDPVALEGLAVFAEAGCIDCHSGPALSDGKFHRVLDAGTDRGRADGLALLLQSPFNSMGAYFDRDVGQPPALSAEATAEDDGAFRTPTLRNLSRTAPYGHDGRFATLPEVLASPHGAGLNDQDRERLLVFLLGLNGAYPSRPWSDWPAR